MPKKAEPLVEEKESCQLSQVVPEQGQLVEVRRRQWVVADVTRSALQSNIHKKFENLLRLVSIDEDALGEEIQVIWELEPGARTLEKAGLPTLSGPDEPRRMDAFLDSVRWGAATNADIQSLQAPFRSGIAIEDYQLDPLVRSLDMPRVNLLIADDVGLGKTIEAGLIVQELLLRYRARTVLVVCPASLQVKWQQEMQEKFGLDFRIVDTDYMRELRRSRGIHANPWTSFPRLITSMDWIKSDFAMKLLKDILPRIPTYPRKFDMLIVDEAHNVAPVGGGNYALDSLRTQAINMMAPHFEHHLFLSATPHNGDKVSFTALLAMLDSQRFARGISPEPKNLEKIMVRRLKTDIVDKDGNPVFPVRKLEALEVDYDKEEREVHEMLKRYSESRTKRSKEDGGGYGTHFVLKLLKKRLFSSPAAFATTLEKHRENLAGRRLKPTVERMDEQILHRAIQRVDEDYANDETKEADLLDAVQAATSSGASVSAEEKELLDKMTSWASRARERADAKVTAVIDWLERHIKAKGEWANERVIIFTEYRTTQKWLVDILTAKGFGGQDRLMTIFGGMDPKQRETIKAAFQADPDKSPVRILVATDAAAEGIDLQNHCSRMIHFEIPWNPNVLDQRNGRIDRHGQRAKEVLIWHPVSKGYEKKIKEGKRGEGALDGDLEFLMVAAKKVETIRQDLGSVGRVIAHQIEEAMLGKRTTLDTGSAETQAAETRKRLPTEKRVRERVERLHQKLVESTEAFRLRPENVANAVHVALEIANQPSLRPIRFKGAPEGTVFEMPAFQGTWARCAEGLAHPHTQVKRPITFHHDVAKGRDDVVLVHLNHRLAQLSLRLLRSEVWTREDTKKLNRVAVRSLPRRLSEHPIVAVWSRLVITGKQSHRLHEELTLSGGHIIKGKLERLNVTQMQEIADAARNEPTPAYGLEDLKKVWPDLESNVMSAVEARSKDRMRNLESTLKIRKEKLSKDAADILLELKATIEKEIDDTSGAGLQLELWKSEEKIQLEKNTSSLRARIAEIPGEIEEEKRSIEAQFDSPVARTFPVAISLFVPTADGGGGA